MTIKEIAHLAGVSSAAVSVDSHLMALAAEESRLTGQTVYMDEFRRKASVVV